VIREWSIVQSDEHWRCRANVSALASRHPLIVTILFLVPVIGITGGIATGKSSFVNCLGQLVPNAHFFDADKMARELTRSDAAVLAEIRREFGPQILESNSELNRSALRAIVFTAPLKRRALERILHPRIREHWAGEAEKYRSSTEFFFADIPLLYETAGEKLCDRVVVVACSEEIQVERLMKRRAMDRASATAIISSQMPLEEKIRRADHVIWNNGPERVLAEQAQLLVGLWNKNL
jgi:dephospho-CoA kinase